MDVHIYHRQSVQCQYTQLICIKCIRLKGNLLNFDFWKKRTSRAPLCLKHMVLLRWDARKRIFANFIEFQTHDDQYSNWYLILKPVMLLWKDTSQNDSKFHCIIHQINKISTNTLVKCKVEKLHFSIENLSVSLNPVPTNSCPGF